MQAPSAPVGRRLPRPASMAGDKHRSGMSGLRVGEDGGRKQDAARDREPEKLPHWTILHRFHPTAVLCCRQSPSAALSVRQLSFAGQRRVKKTLILTWCARRSRGSPGQWRGRRARPRVYARAFFTECASAGCAAGSGRWPARSLRCLRKIRDSS